MICGPIAAQRTFVMISGVMKVVPAALVMLIALALFTIERRFPLRRETHVLIARLGINVVLSALTFMVALTVVQPAAHRALH